MLQITDVDPWDHISRRKGYSAEFLQKAREANAQRRAQEVAEQERRQAIEVCKSRKTPKWAVEIILEVALVRGVSPFDMMSGLRAYPVVDARHEAIYRVKAFKPMLSSPQIAKWFALDHTSILHSLASYSHQTGAPKLTKYALKTGRERYLLAKQAQARKDAE